MGSDPLTYILSNGKIPPELLRFDGIFMFVLYVKRSAKGGAELL